jgi:hypothetical protein
MHANGHLESDRNGHGLFLASRDGQNPLARVTRSEQRNLVMRTGLLSEEDRKTVQACKLRITTLGMSRYYLLHGAEKILRLIR